METTNEDRQGTTDFNEVILNPELYDTKPTGAYELWRQSKMTSDKYSQGLQHGLGPGTEGQSLIDTACMRALKV